jgi:hypothetical protein
VAASYLFIDYLPQQALLSDQEIEVRDNEGDGNWLGCQEPVGRKASQPIAVGGQGRLRLEEALFSGCR